MLSRKRLIQSRRTILSITGERMFGCAVASRMHLTKIDSGASKKHRIAHSKYAYVINGALWCWGGHSCRDLSAGKFIVISLFDRFIRGNSWATIIVFRWYFSTTWNIFKYLTGNCNRFWKWSLGLFYINEMIKFCFFTNYYFIASEENFRSINNSQQRRWETCPSICF